MGVTSPNRADSNSIAVIAVSRHIGKTSDALAEPCFSPWRAWWSCARHPPAPPLGCTRRRCVCRQRGMTAVSCFAGGRGGTATRKIASKRSRNLGGARAHAHASRRLALAPPRERSGTPPRQLCVEAAASKANRSLVTDLAAQTLLTTQQAWWAAPRRPGRWAALPVCRGWWALAAGLAGTRAGGGGGGRRVRRRPQGSSPSACASARLSPGPGATRR